MLATLDTCLRYPANLLGETLYRARSRFGLVSAAEKRQELVGPAHLWKMKRDFQVNFLKRAGLQPADYFLDLGCGVLRGGIPLIDYLDKGHYYGVEVRPEVLAEAVKAVGEAGLQSKLPQLSIVPDFTNSQMGQHFDMVWAFSVLIHMSDEILHSCLAFVAAHLQPTGRFHANVVLGNAKDGNWQGFPVVYRSLEFYEGAARLHRLSLRPIGSLSSLGHVSGSRMQDSQMMLEFFFKR